MARTATSIVADRIRIEDEVWEEAFSSRIRARPRRRGAESWREDWESQDARPAASAPTRPRARPSAAVDRTVLAPVRAVVDPASVTLEADGMKVVDGEDELPVGTPLTETPSIPAQTRRTVHIQGRGAERHGGPIDGWSRPHLHGRSEGRRWYHPTGNQSSGVGPDRLAMWAVLLGFLLVLVATLSTHF